jgi:hypothetical protein
MTFLCLLVKNYEKSDFFCFVFVFNMSRIYPVLSVGLPYRTSNSCLIQCQSTHVWCELICHKFYATTHSLSLSLSLCHSHSLTLSLTISLNEKRNGQLSRTDCCMFFMCFFSLVLPLLSYTSWNMDIVQE